MLVNRIVQPIHFEDFDGHQFERLVFAFLLRTDNWLSLEWYGQAGADSGTDIWGVTERDGYPRGQKVCVQCANLRTMPLSKIREDLHKVLLGPNGKPDVVIVVCGGKVSAQVRGKAKELFEQKQIHHNTIWSGNEFEERLRAGAEALLRRFLAGEVFPDTSAGIRSFVQSSQPETDAEILALMAGLFDRPAFYTPFRQESSIPAFKKAITDTIEALNTGIHRLRDGTEIRRIPSRHMVKSPEIKRSLAEIERLLGSLRAAYDDFLGHGEIRACGCNVPDCPVFFVSPLASRVIDQVRIQILEEFRRLYPPFDVRLGWMPWA